MSSDKWLVPPMARTWLGVLFLSVAALGFHPIMADTDPGDSKFQFAATLLCLCCRSVLKKGDNNSPDFCSLVFTPGKENLLSDVLLLLNSFVAAALRLLMAEWQNTPPNWQTSEDPCGHPWEGVRCNNSRVTTLKLVSMGLKGTLPPSISSLSELQSLDLSYNKDLGGSLPSSIGNLKQLTGLILIACSFSGSIPSDLGALSQLRSLALNSNNFTGKIPSSLGNLSNLYWLDISENQLTGTLPVSSGTTSGLDKLIKIKHFHFGKNQLSGEIPPEIFHSEMTLIHVLFEANRFTGSIPDTIGLVKTLEVLRIDRNSLTGPVPSSINNLTNVTDLNLANNMLIGSVPDLNGMTNLAFVDLSNNSFSPSKTPTWFTRLPSLTTLVIESGRISGEVPERLFSSSQLQQVILTNNMFSGDLKFSGDISEQLQLVDLQNNNISNVPADLRKSFTLILLGNPYCNSQIPGSVYCQLKVNSLQSYSTNHSSCSYKPPCPQGQSIAPWSCSCACPYKGIMSFRAPKFLDVTSAPRFQLLEASLALILGLTPASISLSHLIFNSDNYLQMQVELFPSDVIYFSRSDIIRLGSILSNQTFRPPPVFGPYVFIPFPYPFPDDGSRKTTISTGIIAGIATSGVVLLIASIALGIYAFWQKRRAETAEKISHPFTSWGEGSTRDSGSAPELKGARRFSFNDIKNYTNNFSVENEIGSGGYGKVYRGSLPSGELVAIKRAHTGSMQGGLEFKTEIELLSRVHHKNLVRLVGFCFEQEEQMLIYEYIPNGTLRQSLSGERGIVLNWYRRLRVAVDSAKGLAYLHELADPPIIHRDVKSSNILLDENLFAKVADFGLSKQLSDAEKGLISTQIKGTRGYLDPEYYLSHNLTEKSDVYSFGVVMLELITAKQAIERGMYVVHEVKLSFNRNDDYYGLRDLLDPVIQNTPNFAGFRRFVELAIRCVEELGDNRPSMSDVVKEIEAILQENRLIVRSTSSSTTEIFEGKGIPNHTYVESTFGKEVDSSSDTLESSIGYVFSHKVEAK